MRGTLQKGDVLLPQSKKRGTSLVWFRVAHVHPGPVLDTEEGIARAESLQLAELTLKRGKELLPNW